jgi:hypothetical protein
MISATCPLPDPQETEDLHTQNIRARTREIAELEQMLTRGSDVR